MPNPNQLAIEYPVQSNTANVKSTSAAVPKTHSTASIKTSEPPPAPPVGEPSPAPAPAAAAPTAAPSSAAAPTTATAPTPLQAPPPLQARPPQYTTPPMISEAYLNPVVSLIPVSNPSVVNGLVNYGMDRYLR